MFPAAPEEWSAFLSHVLNVLIMLHSDFRSFQERQKTGKTLAIVSAAVFVLVIAYTIFKLYNVF